MVRFWLGPQKVERQEQASIASAIEGANLRKINLSPYSLCVLQGFYIYMRAKRVRVSKDCNSDQFRLEQH
ncbi:hypothetical protein D3C84_667270 [compost metagenome]